MQPLRAITRLSGLSKHKASAKSHTSIDHNAQDTSPHFPQPPLPPVDPSTLTLDLHAKHCTGGGAEPPNAGLEREGGGGAGVIGNHWVRAMLVCLMFTSFC